MRAAEHLVVTSGSLDRDERHEVVIHAVHLLQHVHRMSVALDVVAPAPTNTYGIALRQLVHALRVTDAEFIDAATDGFAATSLAHATCFVSARSVGSVPGAVDAVAAGVPTITTSIPPIAGSLALPPGSGPLLVAEAILATIADPALRSALVNSARESSGHGS